MLLFIACGGLHSIPYYLKLERVMGIGAPPIRRSRPPALLSSASGGLFLALLGAKLHSIPYYLKLERVMGIEPTLRAWEARVLPLNYTRQILRSKI